MSTMAEETDGWKCEYTEWGENEVYYFLFKYLLKEKFIF